MSGYLATINGPYTMGYSLSFLLMGALAVQAYIYFTSFPDDRRTIKILVLFILLLETIMTIFGFYSLWIGTTVYSTTTPSRQGAWGFLVLAPMTGVVTMLTHGFFCWRIWVLRNSLWVPIPVMILSLLQLVSVTYLNFTEGLSPVITFVDRKTGQFVHIRSPFLMTWLGSSLVCDFAITTCMMLGLQFNSTFNSTKSTLDKLTKLTLETGLVTTIAALIELVLGLVYFHEMYHVAVYLTISKLYANCLLASLNFRLVIRTQSDLNATDVVWHDRSGPSSSLRRSSHGMHILARGRNDMNTNVDSDEAVPMKMDFVDRSSEAPRLPEGGSIRHGHGWSGEELGFGRQETIGRNASPQTDIT